jgi:hypothetical protein
MKIKEFKHGLDLLTFILLITIVKFLILLVSPCGFSQIEKLKSSQFLPPYTGKFFVDRFTVLHFTATGASLAARQI